MSAIDRLLEIMQRLRDPQGGCPWDLQQTFATIAPFTIEEAYEVADAIARGDMIELRDELGDLLFQVIYHAQMANEQGAFDFEAVAQAIGDKLVRRHPHVFAGAQIADAEAQTQSWEAIKAAERQRKAGAAPVSVLEGISLGMPALSRSLKLQSRAARVGFDWDRAEQVLDKIEEEIGELRAEVRAAASRERLEDELGDIFFALSNLARHLKVDPEAAVRSSNAKFERRFRHMEAAFAADGQVLGEQGLERLEAAWQAAKREVG